MTKNNTFTLTAQEVCYVCGLEIEDKPFGVGHDKYRHENCEPGSARWLKSEHGKKSEFYQFFEEE